MENQQHSIVLYQADSTNVCVSVCYANETFWLTQKAMAELFGVNVPNISKHLSNIYEEGELRKEATVSKMEIVQVEGERNMRFSESAKTKNISPSLTRRWRNI